MADDLLVLAVGAAALPGWFVAAFLLTTVVALAGAGWALAAPANRSRCACGTQQDGRR